MRRVCSVWLCGVLALQFGGACTFDSGGLRWLPIESDCVNAMDDDGDGFVDCADDDCSTHPSCQSNSNNNTNQNTNPGPEYCTNNIDDDGDGLVDCADPQCAMAPTCLGEECTNGVDDDGDGLEDCDDPDCSAAPACVPEECTNNFDDNGNGLVDCDDPQCVAAPNCVLESCGNDVDDDGDGRVDCDDDDCLNTPECGVCHPMSNAGCGTGTTCYLTFNDEYFGSCVTGSGSGGGQWVGCSVPTDCQLGYYCSFGFGSCVRVCHPGENDCSSIGGTWCEPFSDFGSTSPWGMCVW